MYLSKAYDSFGDLNINLRVYYEYKCLSHDGTEVVL